MDVRKNIHCAMRQYNTYMTKTLGKILLTLGILAALFIIGRGLYYSPNGDTGTGALASSAEGAAHSENSLPDRLLIPKLGIDADIQHVGVTKEGNMAAPNNFVDVSWYKFGAVPGQLGSAVIAGHEDNAVSLDGVFKHLEDLQLGDRIYVEDASGAKLEFKVVEKAIYPYNDSPTERIFNAKGKARLNLITCAGDWLPEAKTNDKRLVVYTELVP
jgi:LPXTG-site transpeptidase (sortase) family protein